MKRRCAASPIRRPSTSAVSLAQAACSSDRPQLRRAFGYVCAATGYAVGFAAGVLIARALGPKRQRLVCIPRSGTRHRHSRRSPGSRAWSRLAGRSKRKPTSDVGERSGALFGDRVVCLVARCDRIRDQGRSVRRTARSVGGRGHRPGSVPSSKACMDEACFNFSIGSWLPWLLRWLASCCMRLSSRPCSLLEHLPLSESWS